MSELDPDEWDGVYYDGQAGVFVTVDIDSPDADEVTIKHHEGEDTETIGREEFIDMEDDFWPMPPAVVNNPAEILRKAASERANQVEFSEGIAIKFALEFTDVSSTIGET